MNKKKVNDKNDIAFNQNSEIEYMFDGPAPIPPDIKLSDEDRKRIKEEHKKLGIND